MRDIINSAKFLFLVTERVRDSIGPPSHFTVDVSSEDSMKCA